MNIVYTWEKLISMKTSDLIKLKSKLIGKYQKLVQERYLLCCDILSIQKLITKETEDKTVYDTTGNKN